MSSVILLAAMLGQLPTPQLQHAPPAAAAPPQTLVLLQYAAPAVPTAPSVLVASPPPWDRFLAHTGNWLTARAAKHQHAKAAQLVTAVPTTVQVVAQPTAPVIVGAAAVPAAAVPHAAPQSASSESVPTPVNFQPPPPSPVIIVPDPAGPLSPRRLFGSG